MVRKLVYCGDNDIRLNTGYRKLDNFGNSTNTEIYQPFLSVSLQFDRDNAKSISSRDQSSYDLEEDFYNELDFLFPLIVKNLSSKQHQVILVLSI